MKIVNPPDMKSGPGERRCTCLVGAFTLIELLVVIAVLVILAAMLLPALFRGKASAQRIVCLNHLKQWSLATRLYCNDNAERLPRESALDGINTWEMTRQALGDGVWYNELPETLKLSSMAYYAETPSSQNAFYSRNIFHCPRARFTEVAATYPNFSLAMNSKLMGDFESTTPTGSFDSLNHSVAITRIKAPARTALFLDAGVPGEARLTDFQPPYTGEPKAYAGQFSGRHNRAGNILFADGHASTFRGEAVVDMNPDSVYRGGAIYPPVDVVWATDPDVVP